MIHSENPFTEPPDQRDPVRRFRGRLTAPVTVVTAGSEHDPTGLTVSSLIVIEGDPGVVQLVVGPTTDLWESAEKGGRFVVHICHRGDRETAQVFAGLRPNPGGIFAGVDVEPSEYGPVIRRLPNRAYCQYMSKEVVGWSGIMRGSIDRVEAGDITDPLVYFRGGYRTLR